MHIDMNSYFATVEQQANPHLRGKPVGVGGPNDGRSVVAAASIEAKRFGVKSGMTIHEARRLCPGIIFVQGDYNKYACVTDRVCGYSAVTLPLWRYSALTRLSWT